MESYTQTLNKDTWFEVANNVDYVLQHVDSGENKVLVKASAIEPTSNDGSFVIRKEYVLHSSILPGRIWAKAQSRDIELSYSK